MVMDRKECLDAAKQCVCSDRNQQYGSPAVNMKKIAEFWTTYKGVEFSPKDVGVMMALLKIARISSGQSKDDNYIDACGYLSLSCELETEDSTGTTSTIKI
jgi:hypothetical protein